MKIKMNLIPYKEPFYMGIHPVTQEQWVEVMGQFPNGTKSYLGNNVPITNVNFNDVQEFIKKLNEKVQGLYYLPTEEEWEFAAKGGVDTDYAGSNDIDEVGWCYENSKGLKTVGLKKANGYGLYDMSGNVLEWCNSFYDYKQDYRVLRGGSWFSSARYCCVSGRIEYDPDNWNFHIGFRLAHKLQPSVNSDSSKIDCNSDYLQDMEMY